MVARFRWGVLEGRSSSLGPAAGLEIGVPSPLGGGALEPARLARVLELAARAVFGVRWAFEMSVRGSNWLLEPPEAAPGS